MKTMTKIAVIAIVAAIALIIGQSVQIKRIKAERDAQANNTEALMAGVETYRVRDSLNAARVQALELTMKEYERFRAEDAELIKSLKAKNRDLAAVNKSQTATIIDLKAQGRDTVIIRDSVPLPALSFSCGDRWYTFDAIVVGGEMDGKLSCRDSIYIAESVKYHRFLGFLWKTRRVDERHIDVVSSNPHTKIEGVEFVFIEK